MLLGKIQTASVAAARSSAVARSVAAATMMIRSRGMSSVHWEGVNINNCNDAITAAAAPNKFRKNPHLHPQQQLSPTHRPSRRNYHASPLLFRIVSSSSMQQQQQNHPRRRFFMEPKIMNNTNVNTIQHNRSSNNNNNNNNNNGSKRWHGGPHVNHDHAHSVHVTFVDGDGKPIKADVDAYVGESLLQVAQRNDIELEGACEGVCACSTCHVIFPDWDVFESLEEASEDEEDMLDMAFGLTETSRLSCQIIVTEEMDGLTVEIPKATRNFYVDGHVPVPH